MLTDSDLDLPWIDHHCHGVTVEPLDWVRFQALFSESYRPPPRGTTEFQKPLGLAIRRWCAPILDLEPFASGEAYVARRQDLGVAEVNRRLFGATPVGSLLIDTGHRADTILDVPGMAALTGRPCFEVVRIEAVAEAVARSGVDAAGFGDALAEALAARAGGAVGFKSIVAYRVTFAIEQTAPDAAAVAAAAGAWLQRCAARGRVRMDDPVLIRHGLWVAADLCRQRRLPLQLHVGIGDPDIVMHACDPSHFTAFIAAMEQWGVAITLLHNWPFLKEACWMSEVFENVYYDTGVIMNYGAAEFETILGEALQIGKYSKFLYSSDAFGLPELHYLGLLLFRRGLKRVLDRWLAEEFINLAIADEILRMIATENAGRIYPVG